MTTEQIYDKEIFPIMEEVIRICNENNISFFADFVVKDEDDELLSVSCGRLEAQKHRMMNALARCGDEQVNLDTFLFWVDKNFDISQSVLSMIFKKP
jgi:hypothetical protein